MLTTSAALEVILVSGPAASAAAIARALSDTSLDPVARFEAIDDFQLVTDDGPVASADLALELADRLCELQSRGLRGTIAIHLDAGIDIVEAALVLDAVLLDRAFSGDPRKVTPRLRDVVLVTDASAILHWFANDGSGSSDSEIDFDTPERLASGIEFATVVLLTGCDRVARADLSLALALVQKLNPSAPRLMSSGRVDTVALRRRARSGATLFGASAGWMRELSGRGELPQSIAGVTTAVFSDPMPFHPARLSTVIEHCLGPDGVGEILRSRGFLRLATRPHTVGSWASAGRALTIAPTALPSWHSDSPVGQDIVFFGRELDHDALELNLRTALLTAGEFLAGPEEWATLADPFPVWLDAGSGHHH